MKRRQAFALLLALVGVAPAVHAEPLRDETTGFALDLDVSPDVPCVILPRATEGSSCRTANDDALAAQLEASPETVLFAERVDHADWSYVLIVSRRAGGGELDEHEIHEIGEHIGDVLQKPGVDIRQPSPRTTVMRSDANVQVVSAPVTLTTTTTTGAGVTHMHVVSHFISGAGRFTLTTTTDEAHATEVDQLAMRMLGAAKLDPPMGGSNATPLEASVSYFVRAMIGIALLVVAVIAVRKLGRRR